MTETKKPRNKESETRWKLKGRALHWPNSMTFAIKIVIFLRHLLPLLRNARIENWAGDLKRLCYRRVNSVSSYTYFIFKLFMIICWYCCDNSHWFIYLIYTLSSFMASLCYLHMTIYVITLLECPLAIYEKLFDCYPMSANCFHYCV